MNRLIKIAIPSLTIIFFILFMNSGPFLQKSFSSQDNFQLHWENAFTAVDERNWENAADELKKLEKAWQLVQKRVQFTEERNEMNSIDENLGRLDGFIYAQDFSSSLAELTEIKKHWDTLDD